MKRSLPFVALCFMASFNALADSCLMPPTDAEIVSGRFGKSRGGGADNFGSANQNAHMHDGLDFSTSGVSKPVKAPGDATVVYAGARGSAGNGVLMQLSNKDIIAFYHLSAVNVHMGEKITAGQQVGVSGNTPSTSMAKHLHLTYGSSDKNDVRAKAFNPQALRGTFDPASLSNTVKFQSGIGYKTDPSPHFCQTFTINDGHPEDAKILGGDTKSQYAILFGSALDGGTPVDGADDVQIAAGNSDALKAQASGESTAAFVEDSGVYGALPEPPIGKYSTLSASEMMQTEAYRRFTDSDWNTELTRVGQRALILDYVRAQGLENYIDNQIMKKKDRIEGLMALLTSNQLNGMKEKVSQDMKKASVNNTINAIK
ncbi:M23 family metallopeptidase [Acerihabitans sp. TG2]|uniref:M23 family metallopeptidase n=1 Tax=Acerihabitans sp. TG2 TaxID=3096008 RepID=UPI002B228CDB|nr:M23 family metallopeptidase [Acerihabitans sp. TG2]MEA9392200.1 M23 family metallopeptidase [Acerihabitans sp. TG2]